jgi:tetratricopeptide (TPR) repeat protein
LLARPFAPLPLLLFFGFAALTITAWLKAGDLTAIGLPWRGYFERASVNPKALAYVKSGDALLAQGEYDDAIAEYTQALDIDPNYAAAYEGRGNVYFFQGYYDSAIIEYNRIILLSPKYAEAYFRRAVAYYNKGDYERAIAGYNEAIRLNPRFVLAYTNRQIAYLNRNNPAAPSPITFGLSASNQIMQTPATTVSSPATARPTTSESWSAGGRSWSTGGQSWPTMGRSSSFANAPWHSSLAASAPRTTTSAAPSRAAVRQSGWIRR